MNDGPAGPATAATRTDAAAAGPTDAASVTAAPLTAAPLTAAPPIDAGPPTDAAAAAEAVRRLRGAARRRRIVATLCLVGALAALGLAALGLGQVRLGPAEVVAGLLGTDPAAAFIVTGLRLPRFALALVVGAALGLSGGLLQSVLRNPLASPDILGLTGGASAAAVLAIAAGAVGAAVDLAAVTGALVAAAVVLLLGGHGTGGTRVVLVGIAVAFGAQGVLGYGLTRASLTEARSAYFWLVGSVGTAPWSDVARVGAVVALAVVVLVSLRRPLALLALDDDTARAVGARPAAVRGAAVALSALLAAAAVAVAGPIAFVAFLSGPVARRLRGGGPALGTAALVGAVAVTAADLVAQHLLPGALQPPAGLITGAVGAPVLLWVLVRGVRPAQEVR